MEIYTGIKMYQRGIIGLQKQDYKMAQFWLERSFLDPKLKEQSAIALINLDFTLGNYAQARKRLKSVQNSSTVELKMLQAKLETFESNYEMGKQYYSECMEDAIVQMQAFYQLALLYMQTGDYDIARNMLETLRWDNHLYLSATLELIDVEILDNQYKKAYQLLQNINKDRLPENLYKCYQKQCYRLSQLYKKASIYQDMYTIGESRLLNHVSKHLDPSKKETYGCFFSYTDLKKLLAEVRTNIEFLNPGISRGIDIYRFSLKNPIGFSENTITNDICVVTLLKSKDIITMYPISLSEEFDKEGNTTNKQLKIKRMGEFVHGRKF